MAFEALEQRTLLAAGVAAETVAILPPEPLPGDANQDGLFDQMDVASALQVGRHSGGGDDGVDSHVLAAKAHGRAELPHRNWGDNTIVLDFGSSTLNGLFLTVPWTMTGSGIATQLGRFENAGTGTTIFDVSGETPIPVLTEGSGCATITATGDEISWVGESIGPSQHAITYTHGTGRFVDVEGGFTYDYTPDPGNPPHVLSFDYVGAGTITF